MISLGLALIAVPIAVWFGNSKQHFAFSAYDRLQGWNKLADKWKEEAEEEWDEAEEVLNRLVELGCKPADLQEAMKTIEFPFYDDPKQQIESDYAPDAVKDLSELAQAFADDYPTQKLILKWIARPSIWPGKPSICTSSRNSATRISSSR